MQDNVMQLHDGRKLGYSEYGQPSGTPLLLFHGTPGSRIIKRLESASWIQRFGMRVVVPERPGYGLSAPSPKRTIKDWAGDVADLADHLGFERFHVAGGSGGGAYALACAIELPTHVLSATLFCSGGPPEVMPASKEMSPGNRIAFFLARRAPFLLKGLLAVQARSASKVREGANNAAKTHKQARVAKRVSQQLAKWPEWDRRILESCNPDDLRTMLHEAYRQGTDGTYRDFILVSHPWRLDLDKLMVPVFMWHGTADTMVPVSTAREFAKLIPGCEAHFIPDAGHQLLGSDEVCSQMASRMLSVSG